MQVTATMVLEDNVPLNFEIREDETIVAFYNTAYNLDAIEDARVWIEGLIKQYEERGLIVKRVTKDKENTI